MFDNIFFRLLIFDRHALGPRGWRTWFETMGLIVIPAVGLARTGLSIPEVVAVPLVSAILLRGGHRIGRGDHRYWFLGLSMSFVAAAITAGSPDPRTQILTATLGFTAFVVGMWMAGDRSVSQDTPDED